ncbi:uncharacterized protein Z518_10292 [Rhinocladiella mackenziei CBS 650.93]|uniref:RING-type E3 ubiquitin transferase n=1 Tax=Rhinocladiella mackenziei CBS 650.93 TaxID=1442369 RepID=A0A0D2ITU1_9EURO|nr:uncharacterized protein Z518_10292 [Rhinocladiella mackenziei CBS 650.93]KIX00155.1 hypothetical protein Z518_10292 [Rhinocladiella mackenziei CBS 650.93]
MSSSQSLTETPSSPRGGSTNRGNRSNRRNSSTSQNSADNRGRGTGPRGSRGQRGGRGRSQGHGHGLGQENAPSTISLPSESTAESSSGRPPGGSFGARLTGAASKSEGDSKGSQPQEDEAQSAVEDKELCFICASPIEHVSISPCNHQTCHICSLRLRALYKTRACAHCRTEAPFVIFTDNAEKRFDEFDDEDFVKIDENLGIKYEKDVIWEDTRLLLRYNCPDKDCEVACLGWPDLHRHVKTKHGKIMCDLCTRNKKVFTHEHELFTFGELRRHERFGDDNPGAIDQSGFKGHPECGFCKQRFYGDDELYNHCREKHEKCHICDRRNGGRNPQYYLNYQELEKHFAETHFVCMDAECQANKTNVFESEMDLKAHQLSEHPNGLSKDARRDARLVNLSGFDIRAPYQPQRRGGRENRGSGRGRDPNAEPLPLSSAQPLGRAELAYQRQLAIQSSQSVSTRTFGGQLTQSVPAPHPQPATAPSTQELPAVENISLESPTQSTVNMTPQEQARALRHQAVTNRAVTLLKNDKTKLSQFRTHVSAYRSGTSSATDLIDAFFSLLDCSSAEMGKLVRELADLYEDEPKRQSLLQAWNDWRSINEDYPSLPGPSGTLPGVSSGTAGSSGDRRVLTLKRSTAQSSRSAVSRQGSWGNALAIGMSQDPFPALSSTNASSRKQGTAIAAPAPWGNTTAPQVTKTTISNAPVSRPTPKTASTLRQATRSSPPPRQTEEMFPALPTAPKPNTTMAGFNTRGSGRWLGSSRNSPSGSGTTTPVNPWGNGGLTPTPAQAAVATAPPVGGVGAPSDNGAIESGEGTVGRKKGKKSRKGETLFHFG